MSFISSPLNLSFRGSRRESFLVCFKTSKHFRQVHLITLSSCISFKHDSKDHPCSLSSLPRLHSLLRSPQSHFHFYRFSKTALVKVTKVLHIAKFQSQLILRPHFPQLEEQLTLDIASSLLRHFLVLVLRRSLSAFHLACLAIPCGSPLMALLHLPDL